MQYYSNSDSRILILLVKQRYIFSKLAICIRLQFGFLRPEGWFTCKISGLYFAQFIPSHHFNLVWTVEQPYTLKLVSYYVCYTTMPYFSFLLHNEDIVHCHSLLSPKRTPKKMKNSLAPRSMIIKRNVSQKRTEEKTGRFLLQYRKAFTLQSWLVSSNKYWIIKSRI